MSAEPSTFRVESRPGIAILSLDRPETLNAMSPAMAGELSDYFLGLRDRPEVRVVILRSNGRAFCAGAELGSDAFAEPGPGRPQRQLAMQRLYSGLVRHMRGCPQPIIGLIHGPACGAGFSLALACDVRYASPEARMNAAYLLVGLGGCDMGSGYLLPRLIGMSLASELLLSGRFVGADRARAIGLVSDVVPAEQLLQTGLALAGDMLRASPLGLRLTKETLNAVVDAPGLDGALTIEDRQQVMLLETGDFREAVAAFKDRRPPRYTDA